MTNIPSDIEIENMLSEFYTPPHIIEHCKKVADVSLFIAGKMTVKGLRINVQLLKAAAMLHDLIRIVDFRAINPERFPKRPSEQALNRYAALRERFKNMHHAVAGAAILREFGYPELAEIVKKHRFLQIEQGFDTWEEKILYYADKRVKHSTIVSLKERLGDGRKRNAPEKEGLVESEVLDKKVFALEKEICEMAGMKPEELTG